MNDLFNRYLPKNIAEMSDEDYYQEHLLAAMCMFCEIMNKDTEAYDQDKAIGDCFADCFRDVSNHINKLKDRINELENKLKEIPILKNPNEEKL